MQEISNLIHKFANSFDVKDWSQLKATLADEIICDYSDLKDEIKTLSPEAYVEQRIATLSQLRTQHLFSNLEIYQHNQEFLCRCSALILRTLNNSYLNTHAFYEFKIHKKDNAYFIFSIKQTVLWNEGDTNIHKGINQKS